MSVQESNDSLDGHGPGLGLRLTAVYECLVDVDCESYSHLSKTVESKPVELVDAIAVVAAASVVHSIACM